jgi:DNA-binding response OmpR family regulator
MELCPQCEARWHASGVRVDASRKQASWPGGELRMPPKQARLLDALAKVTGKVVRYGALIDAL